MQDGVELHLEMQERLGGKQHEIISGVKTRGNERFAPPHAPPSRIGGWNASPVSQGK